MVVPIARLGIDFLTLLLEGSYRLSSQLGDLHIYHQLSHTDITPFLFVLGILSVVMFRIVWSGQESNLYVESSEYHTRLSTIMHFTLASTISPPDYFIMVSNHDYHDVM